VQSSTAAEVVDLYKFPDGNAVERINKPKVNLARVKPGIVSFSPYLQTFERLRIDQRWSDIEFDNCKLGVSTNCIATAQVRGREKVTTKAGTFNAWKVVLVLDVSILGVAGGGSAEYTYWFADAVGRVVKYQHRQSTRTILNHPDPPIDMELVSYVPASAGATAVDAIKRLLLSSRGLTSECLSTLAGMGRPSRPQWFFVEVDGKFMVNIVNADSTGAGCSREVTLTATGMKFDTCRDLGIVLTYNPKVGEYPFTGTGAACANVVATWK
jgi:hypothetical protein